MIIDREPHDWRELQYLVAKIFDEIGCAAELDKTIKTVRGTVSVDVFVKDPSHIPPLIFLCECKYWSSSIPKTVVHAFRTVVSDFGANRGYLISKLGFQSGAKEAVYNSSVELMTWAEFQSIFYDRWVQAMTEGLYESADVISEYIEILEDRWKDVNCSEDSLFQCENLIFRSGLYISASRWLHFSSREKQIFPIKVNDPYCPRGKQGMVQLNNYREYFDLAYTAVPGLLAEWRDFLKINKDSS